MALPGFIKYNYGTKTVSTPTIFNIVPEKYQKYFLRGWIDGDGCFYSNKKSGSNQFALSGSYTQDWTVIEDIFKQYDTKYTIQRIITKKADRYSCIRITNRKAIGVLSSLIYSDQYDSIGLKRKFNKCSDIVAKRY